MAERSTCVEVKLGQQLHCQTLTKRETQGSEKKFKTTEFSPGFEFEQIQIFHKQSMKNTYAW